MTPYKSAGRTPVILASADPTEAARAREFLEGAGFAVAEPDPAALAASTRAVLGGALGEKSLAARDDGDSGYLGPLPSRTDEDAILTTLAETADTFSKKLARLLSARIPAGDAFSELRFRQDQLWRTVREKWEDFEENPAALASRIGTATEEFGVALRKSVVAEDLAARDGLLAIRGTILEARRTLGALTTLDQIPELADGGVPRLERRFARLETTYDPCMKCKKSAAELERDFDRGVDCEHFHFGGPDPVRLFLDTITAIDGAFEEKISKIRAAGADAVDGKTALDRLLQLIGVSQIAELKKLLADPRAGKKTAETIGKILKRG